MVIDNCRRAGRSVSRMEKLRDEAFHVRSPAQAETLDVEEEVKKLKQRATKSEGCCSVCGKHGKLLNGVCKQFFLDWAASSVTKARGRT